MKTFLALLCSCVLLPVVAAHPAVTDITLSTDARGDVTVSYSVDADAIVTADFLLDGELVDPAKVGRLSGKVGVPVKAGEANAFHWLASLDLPDMRIDAARLQVRLTPFAPSAPPDYAVVSLLTNAPNPIVYYVSTNCLPGGLFANGPEKPHSLEFAALRVE